MHFHHRKVRSPAPFSKPEQLAQRILADGEREIARSNRPQTSHGRRFLDASLVKMQLRAVVKSASRLYLTVRQLELLASSCGGFRRVVRLGVATMGKQRNQAQTEGVQGGSHGNPETTTGACAAQRVGGCEPTYVLALLILPTRRLFAVACRLSP